MSGYVYAIGVCREDLVKIGKASDLKARLSALRSLSPYPLELRHSVETREPWFVERALHRSLKEFRRHGEWFYLNPSRLTQVFADLTNTHDPVAMYFWENVDLCPHGRCCKRCCWEWGQDLFRATNAKHDPFLRSAQYFSKSLDDASGIFIMDKVSLVQTCRNENKRCCNPAHLAIRTRGDVLRDAHRRRVKGAR